MIKKITEYLQWFDKKPLGSATWAAEDAVCHIYKSGRIAIPHHKHEFGNGMIQGTPEDIKDVIEKMMAEGQWLDAGYTGD